MKKSLSFILVLVMFIGMLPQFSLPAQAEETVTVANEFEGKTISILGDSISTYTGVSNNTAYNATLSGSAIYYTEGRLGVYRNDTWWQQTIDTLGLELAVNNSWSGSCIFNTRAGTVGAYVDRSVQLHNAEGVEPDIIAIYLGTNDFCNYKSTLGTAADIDYASLITKTKDGYNYATPTTAAEAYAIMLHKAMIRYPNAEVYCFTLLPQKLSNANVLLLEQFNQTILEIADYFDAYSVDLYRDSGIKYDEHFATYVADNSLHPGLAGMDAITGCFISSILENSQYVTKDIHRITYDLNNAIVDQGTAYAIAEGDTFFCSLTAPSGYDLTVHVTMDEFDITASSYTDDKINISSVTGDIRITATAVMPTKDAENYRWEFDGTELISVGNKENLLTRLAGSITNGVHSNSRYVLAERVVLYHDRPWLLEWKSEGTWITGALLFSGAEKGNVTGSFYLYRRQNNDLIAIGTYDGSNYQNYGVAMSDHSIDCSAEHVYRLENRIADDGSNMIWLYVDGVEIGPMNQHSVGGAKPTATSDFLSGKDFVFTHLGATTHPINNCFIDYIQVTECEHNYKDGICTACGAEQPAPIITKQPENVELALGERFSFTVEAEGEGLTYQWYYKDASMESFAVSSVKSATYSFDMLSFRIGREYYCVVTDANGNSVQTDTVKAIVPVTVTLQPQNAQAEIGEIINITVEAVGEGLTYQWYYKEKNGSEFSASAFTGTSYSRSMENFCDGRAVYCVITDKYGNTVTTDTVFMSRPLTIVNQPQNVIAKIGEIINVTVEADGEGLTYQWYYKEKNGSKFSTSAFTGTTYSRSMKTFCDGREVYCVITDKYGNTVITNTVGMYTTEN